MDRHTDAVADSGRKNAAVLALRVEHKDVSAFGLRTPCGAEWIFRDPFLQRRRIEFGHIVGDIAGGPDRYEHLRAVLREDDVAGPVRRLTGCQLCDTHFGCPTRLQVAIAVREADDRTAVADVDPFRVGIVRVEGNAEWALKTGRKDLNLAGGGTVDAWA